MDPFDLVGDVLDDQYRIDECAGEGVLSVVYRGRHLGVDADVAVKCLNLPPTMDEALAAPVAESFRQGCRLHYRLARGNLHIAQTIASGTTIAPRTGTVVPYLVREWFEGESLAKNFASRREEGKRGRTLEDVLDLFQGAADALRYAHSQDISHLSLTPSNFFLTQLPLPSQPALRSSLAPAPPATSQRSIKVLDFGVGRAIDVTASDLRKSATPSPGLHLLQPAYAAPEQLSAQLGIPGPASDVYVFALVLLEALSDRIVMDGKDTGQLVSRALDRNVRPGPKMLGLDLPSQVEAIFARALSVEPADRFANVGELWEELLHADVEITSSSRNPSLPPPNFDEEEPTAEMPIEMLVATSKEAQRPSSSADVESSPDWQPSPSATARIRGPSLFRRLRHWKTLGAKGKSAAAEAERDEGPISMPPPLSLPPPAIGAISAIPRAPAPIPSWRPDPPKPFIAKSSSDSKTTVKVAVLDPLPSQSVRPPAPAASTPPAAQSPAAQPTRSVPAAPMASVAPAKPIAQAPQRAVTAPMAPRPFTPKANPKPWPPKAPVAVTPPVPATKPTAKPTPSTDPSPIAAPIAPIAPRPPPPKRQPTLVMFENGIDQSAVARTSSPSSPGLADPVAAAAVAAAQAAARANAPPPIPAAPSPPAAIPPPPMPSAPPIAASSLAPPMNTAPAKPLPPPPPTDVMSALEGLEAIPIPVPPAPPSSAPKLGTGTSPMPMSVPVGGASATPPPLPPPPPPPASDPYAMGAMGAMGAGAIDAMDAMGPPTARSAPKQVTRAPDLPPSPPDPNATAFTQVAPPVRNRRALFAVLAGFVVMLALGVGALVVSSHSGTKSIPSATATTPATTAPPSATETASAPIASASASASAAPSASVALSASASVPPMPTQPKFFKNLALKSVEKVAKDLTDCRDKKGLWGQSAATVFFLNDGTVKDVSIASPFTGKPQGQCVEAKIRTARMAPFLGKPYPVVYYFVIPR